MIGEPIDTLFLTNFDDNYSKAFKVEKGYLKNILCNHKYVIDHIGSTAIKDIRSRPIIDIAIGAGNVYDQINIKDKLTLSGYTYDNERSTLDCFCFYRVIDKKIYFMIYVMVFNSPSWNLAINMRNYLINNTKAKTRYENAKADLLNGVNNDKATYDKLKKEYIKKEIYPRIFLY